MSSNLPPGVTDSMLPGNTPEDQAAEAFADWLWSLVKEQLGVEYDDLPSDKAEAFESGINDAIKHAYADGVSNAQAMAAEAEAAAAAEPDRCGCDGTLVSDCKGVACRRHGRCCWQ